MTDITAAADALVSARHEGRVMSELPGGMPTTVAEAYAIQDAAIDRVGEPVAGWKVAFTNAAGQQRMGIDSPGAGPIFASVALASPASVAMPDPGLRVSECEFAFRLAADLPAKDGIYSDEDIVPLIASVHPAIEIVNRRLSVPMSGLAVVVDFGGNGAFAYGAGTADWRGIDFAGHRVRQIIDGEEKATGSGRAVMDGNPLASVTWLANHLKARGRTLKAGDWISSGSTAEMLPVPAGGTVRADFGTLGVAEVHFPA